MIQKYLKISILSVIVLIGLSVGILTPKNVQAGVCGDVIVLKDGKPQVDNGSFKIPANDKAKWELKVITDRKRKACIDDYAKVTLIFIDKDDKKTAEQEIVPEQKIGTGSEINKTIQLKTDVAEGIYQYNLESRKDQTSTSKTQNGLRITLGQPGKASTGSGGVIAPTPTVEQTVIPPIKDPFKGKTLSAVANQGINILLALIVIAAVVVIIISGFRMIMNGGNPTQLATARRAILWSVVGLLVAFMSFGIVQILQNILQK